jgi:hypothetical protein
MQSPTRRHRCSNIPVRHQRTIYPHAIDERYVEVLKLLEPYYGFKYLTIPWLHYLSNIPVEYSVFRKYLGCLRQHPNNYLVCPDKQNASPNVDRKTLVFELGERGLNVLIERGLVPKRRAPGSNRTLLKPTRNFPFAQHRSSSYYHEIIVDLGYFAPLQQFVRSNSTLRLLEFAQLMQHTNVPQRTRETEDPLLIQLKDSQLRFDGAPHLLIRKHPNEPTLTIGIPGIQVDRSTETLRQLDKHLLNAIEFIEDRKFDTHWGFDNCVIPFLFTSAARKEHALEFVRQERGRCAFLLFQTVPDIGLLRHFPRPEHYSPTYHYAEGEPVHSPSIRIFTNPWQRVGCPDFYLSTFSETPSY